MIEGRIAGINTKYIVAKPTIWFTAAKTCVCVSIPEPISEFRVNIKITGKTTPSIMGIAINE
jgi:hypothetical protein